MKRMSLLLTTSIWCLLLDACGSKVRGHTYVNNGGVVQVEFKSSGKAYVSAGLVNRACNYSESDKTVSLICGSETTNFTIQDDGVLLGPPEGLMARLTPMKN